VAILTIADVNFNQTVTALVRRQIDDNLRNRAVYLQAGEPIIGKIIPGTNLIRFIAYSDLSVTTNLNVVTPGTTPWLVEGTPPTEEEFTIDYEEYGASQAGRVLAISDVALAESPHDLMAVAAERVGVNAALTTDLWTGNILHAGAAAGRVLYSGAATSRVTVAATHNLTAANVRRAVSVLKKNNVPMFGDGMYRAFIDPFISHDLSAEVAAGGWLDVARYASPASILNGEIGRFAGVRFIETNVATLFANAGVGGTVDVYSTFFFGPGAFAFGDLQTIRAYVNGLTADKADPLAQKAQVGWKGMFGALLLTNTPARDRYVRYESASSIGAN